MTARQQARVALAAAAVVLASAAAPARAQPASAGTQGYLDRVSVGTEEVDHCNADSQHANEKTRTRRASEDYNRGLVLYEEGDYEGAITEFVSAYCARPSANMFYNIGQGYEHLLKYEKAVAYFERFIRESSAGQVMERKRAAMRVEALRRLPARIKVATLPAGAQVTLTSDTGVRARGRANKSAPIEVIKGSYTMSVKLPGYKPITRKIVAKIGQPYSYYFQLSPKKSTVRISATPREAQIFVDRRLVGIGHDVERMPVGPHTVTVEADGRKPMTERIEVTADKPDDVRIALARPPKSGRVSLIIASSVAGIGFGAGAFNSIFSGSTTAYLLGGLTGAGIGFGGAYIGVPQDISVGTARYIMGATAVGAAEGGIITAYLTCGRSQSSNGTYTEQCNSSTVTSAALASGIGGILVGALSAQRLDLSPGGSLLIDSGALWGALAGGMFYAAFDEDARIREPLLFAGLNVGLITGGVLASHSNPSSARVALVDLAGLAGTVAGAAVGQALQSNSERLDHFALLGLATGLITGTFVTRNFDEPNSPQLPALAPAVGNARDVSGRSAVTFGVASRW